MGRLETPRQQLGWGLACLAIAGGVVATKVLRQASWGIEALEVIVILLPVGGHLVLKGGLGIDLVARVQAAWRRQGPAQGEEEKP